MGQTLRLRCTTSDDANRIRKTLSCNGARCPTRRWSRLTGVLCLHSFLFAIKLPPALPDKNWLELLCSWSSLVVGMTRHFGTGCLHCRRAKQSSECRAASETTTADSTIREWCRGRILCSVARQTAPLHRDSLAIRVWSPCSTSS